MRAMTIAKQSENNTEASTLNHPKEQGAKIAPSRQCVALMWACKFCLHFSVTKHVEETVRQNWTLGSVRGPLRPVCPNCGKRVRLRSENYDLVWAEVPWRRMGQRRSLQSVAEGLNILNHGEDTLPCKRVAYDLWNEQVGYTGKKSKPQPFKRWEKRGGA